MPVSSRQWHKGIFSFSDYVLVNYTCSHELWLNTFYIHYSFLKSSSIVQKSPSLWYPSLKLSIFIQHNTVHISQKDEHQQISNFLVLSLKERCSKIKRWWKTQKWRKEIRKPRNKRKRKTDCDGRNRSKADERARLSQCGSWPGTYRRGRPCP